MAVACYQQELAKILSLRGNPGRSIILRRNILGLRFRFEPATKRGWPITYTAKVMNIFCRCIRAAGVGQIESRQCILLSFRVIFFAVSILRIDCPF